MKSLLFLTAVTVCWFLVQAKPPTIKMIPKYGVVYWGDTVTLKCNETPSEWLFNGKTHKLSHESQILILPAVSSKDSGNYRCKTGEESNDFNIKVLDYLPPAFLTIVSEHAVVNKNESPLFQLFSDEGLTDWYCRILRNDKETYVRFEDKKAGKTMNFYAEVKGATPEIIWCKRNGTKDSKTIRSNSISLRSSDMEVLLEIPPEPAVVGEPLTLKCEVRGGANIEEAVFYKGNKEIGSAPDGSYEMSVTDGSDGSYKCTATYSYTFVNPHGAVKKNVSSDPQTLTLIRARPPSADITEVADASALQCTCSGCLDHLTFHWYHQEPNAMYLKRHEEKTSTLTYSQPGKYACRAVWRDGASRRSKFHNVDGPSDGSGGSSSPVVYLVVVLIIAGLLFVGLALLRRNKRRGQSGLQGDVPMTRRKKAGEEDEKDPAYEALKGADKDEYQTVRVDGADGGYEAVGAARTGDGGDGGYEALKGKAQAEVYHTLQGPQSQGADGGYEALKAKGQGEAEVYHTLQGTQAQGADGGYEALKATKQSEYETLKSTAGEGGGGGGPE